MHSKKESNEAKISTFRSGAQLLNEGSNLEVIWSGDDQIIHVKKKMYRRW